VSPAQTFLLFQLFLCVQDTDGMLDNFQLIDYGHELLFFGCGFLNPSSSSAHSY
jgi:hypothetical protein